MPYQEIQTLGFPNSPRKFGLYEKPWACISWYGPCTQLVIVSMKSRKLKRLENVSQLKKDFALHSNYSFEIVILVMFLKNCQNLFSFALLIMPTALSGGGRGGCEGGGGGGGRCLLNVLSLLRLHGYLIKRGAYFETRRNYNISLLISKSENVISCQ